MPRPARRLGVALALVLTGMLAAVLPGRLLGQTDVRLVAAVREAQEGQSDSARAKIRRLLAVASATDPLYPEMLYAAGMIAGDAAEMRRRFQQITVEFPTSPWTDDALLRLAQLDYATRQLDGAARSLERIAIDFADSDLLSQAAYWAGRTYFDLSRPTEACRWLTRGMTRSRDDVELQAQLGFLHQRCDAAPRLPDTARRKEPGATPTPSDTAKPIRTAPKAPAATSVPASAAAPDRARFRIQVAAVGTEAAADAVVQRVRALGYSTAIAREGGLYKVRVGGFRSRDAAQEAARRLKAEFGGTPFVVAD